MNAPLMECSTLQKTTAGTEYSLGCDWAMTFYSGDMGVHFKLLVSLANAPGFVENKDLNIEKKL